MNLPILSRPTLPVVSSLPTSGEEGSMVFYNGALYIYSGGQWRRNPPEFPVGSILVSVDNTDPSTWLGYGTWQQFAQGRCLVGVDTTQTEFDTALKTGGAKTHTLSLTEIPPHTHSYIRYSVQVQVPSGTGALGIWQNASSQNTSSVGSGQPHNNLQPYICVYFWRRTA